jgi:hypothetical protein
VLHAAQQEAPHAACGARGGGHSMCPKAVDVANEERPPPQCAGLRACRCWRPAPPAAAGGACWRRSYTPASSPRRTRREGARGWPTATANGGSGLPRCVPHAGPSLQLVLQGYRNLAGPSLQLVLKWYRNLARGVAASRRARPWISTWSWKRRAAAGRGMPAAAAAAPAVKVNARCVSPWTWTCGPTPCTGRRREALLGGRGTLRQRHQLQRA